MLLQRAQPARHVPRLSGALSVSGARSSRSRSPSIRRLLARLARRWSYRSSAALARSPLRAAPQAGEARPRCSGMVPRRELPGGPWQTSGRNYGLSTSRTPTSSRRPPPSTSFSPARAAAATTPFPLPTHAKALARRGRPGRDTLRRPCKCFFVTVRSRAASGTARSAHWLEVAAPPGAFASVYLAGLPIPDEDVRALIESRGRTDAVLHREIACARQRSGRAHHRRPRAHPLGARRCPNGRIGRASRCAAPRARVAETRGARVIDLHIEAE